MDWYIRPPNSCENGQSIVGCLLKGSIAVNGADAEEVQGRMMGSQEDGKSILGAVSTRVFERCNDNPYIMSWEANSVSADEVLASYIMPYLCRNLTREELARD